MLSSSPLATIFKYLIRLLFRIGITGTLVSMSVHASLNANFSLSARYSRNKYIWGTYKLNKEKLSIIRGKKKWYKAPAKRVGDIIISDGYITFIRESKQAGKTKIVVDKIPYKLDGKGVFINRDPLDKDIMDRLYRSDLKSVTPHLDLIQGTIKYKKIKCIKKRGALDCIIKGLILPQV